MTNLTVTNVLFDFLGYLFHKQVIHFDYAFPSESKAEKASAQNLYLKWATLTPKAKIQSNRQNKSQLTH